MTPTAAIASWALAVMLTTAPPGRSRIADAIETPEEGAARYAEIAQAIAEVADGNKRAAALLLAVSRLESGWRRDVDLGIGPHARGSGQDSCLMQIRSLDPKLVADREHCFRTGLKLLRQSMNACRWLPEAERLAAYTSGTCSRGRAESRVRMKLAEKFLAMHPET